MSSIVSDIQVYMGLHRAKELQHRCVKLSGALATLTIASEMKGALMKDVSDIINIIKEFKLQEEAK